MSESPAAKNPERTPWWQKLRAEVRETRFSRQRAPRVEYDCCCTDHVKVEFPEGLALVPSTLDCVFCGRHVYPNVIRPVD